MKRKSVFYFILWAVFIKLATFFSIASEVAMYFRTREHQASQILTSCQRFLVLVVLPFVLIPLLSLSCYYAKKERNRVIKIITICLLVHHLLSLIGLLLGML